MKGWRSHLLIQISRFTFLLPLPLVEDTGLEPDWTYLGTMFTTQFMSITLIILIVLLMHSSSLNAGFGDQ